MAIQRHPVDSFDKTLNFWEEFPDYKVHRTFGALWKLNKKNGTLKESSLFMWALALCFDRKSSIFSQPLQDKLEVTGENLFEDDKILVNLLEDVQTCSKISFPLGVEMNDYILEFEKSIDTPLGMSLRLLEKKLSERTAFITNTEYTMDRYETQGNKNVLIKGTADQLDKMFANTDKINNLILKALESLAAAENTGSMKGGQQASLGDKGDNF